MTNNISKIPAPTSLILLADDLPEVIDSWVDTLTEYGLPCLTASSLVGLNRAYDLYEKEIAAIIIDGCIPGHSVNTLTFIWKVRNSGFKGPVVASSSSPGYRDMMVRAGCTHQAPKDKAAELVADLLSKP